MKTNVAALIVGILLLVNGRAAFADRKPAKQTKPSHAENVNVVNSPNVNVVNSPTVNVGNSPTVTVGNTPSVSVTNTPNVKISNDNTQPALVSATDEPGRIAYQSQASKSGQCTGVGSCFVEFGSVPAGHRLVVQHVSGIVSFPTAPNSVWVQLNNGSGAPVSTFFAPLAPSTFFSAFDQPVQAYIDSALHGGIIEVQIDLIGGTFTSSGPLVTLSGYLLDCNASPCAPIAH